MSTPHMDAVLGRLDRLEREVRRWRLGATILLICAIAALVMGQTLPKPQVIEAQRFILRSSDGKVGSLQIPVDSFSEPPGGGRMATLT